MTDDEIGKPMRDELTSDCDERDVGFMRAAIAAAREAGEAGDVPVGAVIVLDGDPGDAANAGGGGAAGGGAAGGGAADAVIARGFNRRQATNDPTAHAEIEALRAAARTVGNWRIEGTLYVTQEPCPMCAGALVNARIRRLVYGCHNPKAGAVHSLFELVTDTRLNHRMEVTSGVCADECAGLLRDFFAGLRAKKG